MLKFTDLEQKYPSVASAETRKENFNEIYERFAIKAAEDQASRCSQCGIPFCQVHCPLQNNIPDWLKLTAEGRLEEAYEISSATNTFPEICGRICPQDRLCEGNCVIEKGFGSVTIGSVERFITENAWDNGWVKPIKVTREIGKSIAIIGAGPGGLAAAEMLRRQGWKVTIYDRYDRAGGLLIYGIPNFKLEKPVVERRTKWLSEGGIAFKYNVEVGKDISLKELKTKHDAVLIATGVYKARQLQMPGLELANIFPALDYLVTSNRIGLGDKVTAYESGELNATGKKVVVIGGGDTAMDCVRTAIRQGAKSVTCLYRRDRDNMPGSMKEVKNAEEEGVQFMWLSAPRSFMGAKRKVEKVVCTRMKLGVMDGSGRYSVIPAEGTNFNIDTDMVINALGFEAEELPVLFNEPELKTHVDGRINIDQQTFETSIPNVYAAGDVIRGASLVVWAIRDGRDAATAIHKKHTVKSELANAA